MSMYSYERFPTNTKGGEGIEPCAEYCVTICGEKICLYSYLQMHGISLEEYRRKCNNRCHQEGELGDRMQGREGDFLFTSFECYPCACGLPRE